MSETEHQPVLLEIANGVASITLNRPRQLNAIESGHATPFVRHSRR